MGRYSTGARTCEESKSIEISYLLKYGYLKKGEKTLKDIVWYRGETVTGKISILSCLKEEKYIRFLYNMIDRKTGEKEPFDYKIHLTSVPSNLGKGEVLYFICPVSGKRCRVLYNAYGYDRWKSRGAYNNRLYYASQLSSKRDYANDRYWALEKELERVRNLKKHYHHFHKGRLTRHAIRLKNLDLELDKWDWARWQLNSFPLSLRRSLGDFMKIKV